MAFKILLVDDNTIVLEAFSLALRREGFEVDTATCGEAALPRLKIGHHDAVVSDLRMPGRDGLWLLGDVKALDPKTYCVLMSADPQVNADAVADIDQVDLFLEKPVSRTTLIEALRSEKAHRQAANG